MGKSALIKNHFEKVSKSADCIYFDIFPAQNMKEMTEILARNIAEQYYSSSKDHLSKITGFIKSIGAVLSFNEYTGKPEISFGITGIKEPQKTLNDMLNQLNSKKKRTIIAIDEFQQIRNFPEKNTEAYFRYLTQKYNKINYIFLGSSKSIMESIFTESTKPFYQSTDFMHLKEIPLEEYIKFIKDHFTDSKKLISRETTEYIINLSLSHTYYTQLICNRLYNSYNRITNIQVNETIENILKENEPVYFNYLNLLTKTQVMVIKAIASEKNIREPYSIDFIKKYNLPSTSSIKRALEGLLKNEIVIYYNMQYRLYDVLFGIWLKKLNLSN